MVFFGLRPVDGWVFRDATPMEGFFLAPKGFNIFPPSPFTLFGAFRAAIARAMGWSGQGDWAGNKAIVDVVGDGQDPGRLRLMGPLLCKDGELLLPAPHCLLGVEEPVEERHSWQPKAVARPGEEVLCDLGKVRLPEWDVAGPAEDVKLKPPEGWWITPRGLKDVLEGDLPPSGELIHSLPGKGQWLWTEEDRIGIAIDPERRAAATGMIYGCRYLRLAEGVEVVVGLDGGGEKIVSALEAQGLISVGGKGRMSLLRRIDWRWPLEPPQQAESVARPMIVVLTPLGPLEGDWWSRGLVLRPGEREEEIGLKIVCACCPRPVRIGQWSFRDGSGTKRSYLAPGSVIFCEYKDASGPELRPGQLGRCWPEGITGQQELGFGLVAIGKWRETDE